MSSDDLRTKTLGELMDASEQEFTEYFRPFNASDLGGFDIMTIILSNLSVRRALIEHRETTKKHSNKLNRLTTALVWVTAAIAILTCIVLAFTIVVAQR